MSDFDAVFERAAVACDRRAHRSAWRSDQPELPDRRVRATDLGRRHERVHQPHRRGGGGASAAVAGVNADVVYFDASDGLMVTRFVDGGVTMTPERFRADLGAIRRAGRAMHRLHTEAAPFATEYRVFDVIDEYKALLLSKSSPMPEGSTTCRPRPTLGRAALLANPVPVAPCHCDPLCENFLDTGETMYLIDYEYAGNNDPMWDLGDFSVEAGFGPEHDAVLLDAYFEAPTRQPMRPDGDPQGELRSGVVAVGHHPTRQRESGRRLLGLRRRPLRTLPTTDGERRLQRAVATLGG